MSISEQNFDPVPNGKVLAEGEGERNENGQENVVEVDDAISEASSSSARSTQSSQEDEGNVESGSEEESDKDDEEEESESGGSSEESQEDEEDYKKGGYHPVRIGEICANGRYRVLRKLGWGVYSTVWLCEDRASGKFAALKVLRSGSTYTSVAEDELRLLNCIKNSDPNDVRQSKIVQLLTHGRITGPHGTHICMVFEVCGPNLFTILQKRYPDGFPLPMVKSIMKQLLEALDYLHSKCGIIHTDFKPENILTCIKSSHIKKKAQEVEDLLNQGDGVEVNLPPSFVINAPETFPKVVTQEELRNKKISKNMKKKLKKRLKKQNEAEQQHQAAAASAQGLAGCSKNLNKTDGTNDGIGNNNEESESETDAIDDPLDSPDLKVKIGDFGLACYVHKHFSEDIQTRHYRSPEVILRHNYDTAVDIWSAGCVAFELATGDCLFSPKKHKGYTQSEEHLCLMMRILGPIPREFRLTGKKSKEYFNLRTGKLKHAVKFEPRNLKHTLMVKYDWDEGIAEEFSEFLLPMLQYIPATRATAAEALAHPWLNSPDDTSNVKTKVKEVQELGTDDQNAQSGDPIAQSEIEVPSQTNEKDIAADGDNGTNIDVQDPPTATGNAVDAQKDDVPKSQPEDSTDKKTEGRGF